MVLKAIKIKEFEMNSYVEFFQKLRTNYIFL